MWVGIKKKEIGEMRSFRSRSGNLAAAMFLSQEPGSKPKTDAPTLDQAPVQLKGRVPTFYDSSIKRIYLFS